MQEIVASLLEDIAARNDALASACIPHLVAMVAGLMRGLDAGYGCMVCSHPFPCVLVLVVGVGPF
jgi:hypothetical protein